MSPAAMKDAARKRLQIAAVPTPASALFSPSVRTPLASIYTSTVLCSSPPPAANRRQKKQAEDEGSSPARGAWRLRRQLLGLESDEKPTWKSGLEHAAAQKEAAVSEAPEVLRGRQRDLRVKRKAKGLSPARSATKGQLQRLRGKQTCTKIPVPGAARSAAEAEEADKDAGPQPSETKKSKLKTGAKNKRQKR
mmetsp:Transcript_3017/g.5281  ORF Transcript_3017/g.5281 Transcript_3017/m.5281 type:complete len:193 (+) Transcript_3017:39-617(+)